MGGRAKPTETERAKFGIQGKTRFFFPPPEIDSRGTNKKRGWGCFCCGWLFFTYQNHLNSCFCFLSICLQGFTNTSIADCCQTFFYVNFFFFFFWSNLTWAMSLIKVYFNRAIPFQLELVFHLAAKEHVGF